MREWSIDDLRQIRKEEHKKLHIIDILNGKVYDYEPIFKNEQKALIAIQRDVDNLIHDTYDYFPGVVKFDSGMILCVFYHKKKKDIIGTIALNLYNEKNVEYIEMGLSLISKKYRKMGFQSVEARRIREFAYVFLRQGKPFYLSARMASATTQLQVHRGKMANTEGKIINVAYPKGFLAHYIANKDENGNYFLEFGLFYDAWPTLDKVILKPVHLPEIVREKTFQIFDPIHHQDLQPNFYQIKVTDENYVEFQGKEYNWTVLRPHLLIFGDLKSTKSVFCARESKFYYSELAAPDPSHVSIAIESIEDLHFVDIIPHKFKSINITLQISDFPTEESMIANIAVIHVLCKNGFAPICIYDLLCRKKRIRVAVFSKWQNIKLQPYFEFLYHYHSAFEIFWHDCNIQGLTWNPQIEILDEEKIAGKILVERFKTIL